MLRTDRNILPKKSHSGRWLVVGLFVLGIAVVTGFFLAPYKFDVAPTSIWGGPSNEVTATVFPGDSDGSSIPGGSDLVFANMLVGTGVDQIGERLQMSQKPRPQVYYPAQNRTGPNAADGNAIFSKFSLYEGRSIPGKGGSFGVWAAAVVDGRKFMVASVHLSSDVSDRGKELDMLDRAWKELGSPPMIAGGEWQGEQPLNARNVGKHVMVWGDIRVTAR